MIEQVKANLRTNPKKWCITGVAGFIGSNLLEELLNLGQSVVGIDNFSTGHRYNLEDVESQVGADNWARFTFKDGDVRNLKDCAAVCEGVDYVLHQAALGSVPRSIEDPLRTNASNIDGFLNMLVAARDARISRFVYAASSSTYGDHPALPKREEIIGRPLSPYAVTKYVNELYADVFSRIYSMHCMGLRYFNVFGPRQDPQGAYAAVIPRWIGELVDKRIPVINGDGETSRDFCYIENVVEANLLAAVTTREEALDQVYNVAAGDRTSLNELFNEIKGALGMMGCEVASLSPRYGPFRNGDVRHSQADIQKARDLLGYHPKYAVKEGLRRTVRWYWESHCIAPPKG